MHLRPLVSSVAQCQAEAEDVCTLFNARRSLYHHFYPEFRIRCVLR